MVRREHMSHMQVNSFYKNRSSRRNKLVGFLKTQHRVVKKKYYVIGVMEIWLVQRLAKIPN